ncbi:lysozyme family protein [Oceanobacillus sp. M65]|uniref:Lysozyme family protein n=1 Tax=Oceanobacillus jordanicus TaxID=2867266 RepID=A0AAW5B0M5_9BACI|nr:lysozyme family protein [Oceanobacillus jordanicus]MCG3417830.1 lysozyme family protein [Oceanobacillus jordanicus]
MKRRKRHIKAIKRATILFLLFSGIFLILSFLTSEKSNITENSRKPKISEEIRQYQPLVKMYAEQYGVEDYMDVILGIMMQESGGRGQDPMQASESYCGERNCIEDPELSIKQGVSYFSKTLDEASGDVQLAVQSYNFGLGFIDFVQERSGEYSQETAIDFSQHMYEQDPDKEKYRCLREGSRELDACYGDIYYVNAVMGYRDVIEAEAQ